MITNNDHYRMIQMRLSEAMISWRMFHALLHSNRAQIRSRGVRVLAIWTGNARAFFRHKEKQNFVGKASLKPELSRPFADRRKRRDISIRLCMWSQPQWANLESAPTCPSERVTPNLTCPETVNKFWYFKNFSAGQVSWKLTFSTAKSTRHGPVNGW